MALSPAGKALRTCVRCGQTDDHPRHVIGAPAGQASSNFHMDCHALLGCRVCLHQLADVDGAQGEELQGLLLDKAPLTDDEIAALTAPAQEG